MEEKKTKKKKKGNTLSLVVTIIALGVFIYAGYNLYLIFSEYQKGSSEYKALEEAVITQIIPSVTEEDLPKEAAFKVDFEKLKEINSDVLAWIRFDNPEQISYPVVAGVDNAKYLTRTFEGKYNAAGTLFVDKNNSKNFSDRNTFIYGHNMKNGTMFSKLREYKSKAFWEENPYFYIYTPDGMVSKYEIFAACIVLDTSETYTKWYNNDTEYLEYIDYLRSVALYQTDVEVEATDRIVSLSTCTNVTDEERLVVHAVKVSEELVEE